MIYLLQIYLSFGHLTKVCDELEKLRLKRVGYCAQPVSKDQKALFSAVDLV